jgi:ABC-type cobalamin/Fe3+-siderophores transport system ATPase subunit
MFQVCKDLAPDSPLANISEVLDEKDSESRLRAAFLTCSSGHKIVLLTALGLLANIERQSLVLFDEPETHLHPPLLAALMHAFRKILHAHQAFAIIATHSAVVVQETLGRHVHVVRREGDITTVKPVRSETFGESIGLIATEVFGLNSESTDYHRILDELLAEVDDPDAIEALFLDESMSHQARAYILSRLAQRKGVK